MSNELTISAVQPVPSLGESQPVRGAMPAFPAASASQPATQQPVVHPSLRLDVGLGLTVLEFRDQAGAVISSIPSQRQLEAYRMHEQTPPGQVVATPGSLAGPADGTI